MVLKNSEAVLLVGIQTF